MLHEIQRLLELGDTHKTGLFFLTVYNLRILATLSLQVYSSAKRMRFAWHIFKPEDPVG